MSKLSRSAIVSACLSTAVISTSANGEPTQLNLSGRVTEASGSRAADINTAFLADLIFDLDASNAYSFEVISPTDEDPFPRWTFNGTPYKTAFSGNFGSFENTTAVVLETIDNFDADADGNPFGMTGIVDVLSIQSSGVIVDCSNGTVDPVTGCSDPDAPWEEGQEFQVHLVHSSGWFSGMTLPASLPELSELVGVFGDGVFWSNDTQVGEIQVTYTTKSTSSNPALIIPIIRYLQLKRE